MWYRIKLPLSYFLSEATPSVFVLVYWNFINTFIAHVLKLCEIQFSMVYSQWFKAYLDLNFKKSGWIDYYCDSAGQDIWYLVKSSDKL